VADPRDPNPLTLAMVDAARQCGYPITDDFNGPSQLGFGIYQLNQKNGMRWSAARGYLHPALARDNVTAITGALVTRLLFEDRRCTGVVYVADGIEHTVHARKEIILSGGTINSPQLLMLSGIGPRGHLADLGIELVLDLPGVGQNLADHMMVPVAFACTEPVSLAGATTDAQAARFQAEQMGLLTSNVGEAGGFLQLDSGSGAPELQFHFAPGYFIFHGAGNPEGDGFTMAATLVGTRSKGRMWLLSADPGDKPALDPNYLADSRDMDVLVEGTHIARTILGAPAFERYRGAEVLPGSGVDGRQDLEGHIRDYATGIYHPVGTCRMGDDDLAVVDNRLRVHGIDGLRIADASIMPQIINANTNNLCIAIGEKCAEFAMGRIEVPAPDPAAVRHTVT
jgi:choline dehydrogenase